MLRLAFVLLLTGCVYTDTVYRPATGALDVWECKGSREECITKAQAWCDATIVAHTVVLDVVPAIVGTQGHPGYETHTAFICE